MKLQLTVFAQDLEAAVGSDDGSCNPFAVVAQVHPNNQATPPTVLGKTETLRNTLDPDFTKIFILHDFELGKPLHVLVTLHDAKHANRTIGGSSGLTFDVGAVLGTKGGVLGKQIHPAGGYLMVHVERASGLGTLNLKLRGIDLVSQQDQVDPYFELQKKRKTTAGKTVWDVVFRSMPVQDTKNPMWSQVFIDLGLLCGGKKKQKFRISVKDYDDSDDTLIGSCFTTVNDLLEASINDKDGADEDDYEDDGNDGELNTDKGIPLMRPRPMREVGQIVVASASIGDAAPTEPDIVLEEEEFEDDEPKTSRAALPGDDDDDDAEEEDIILEPTDDIEILPDEDLNSGGANFADYIAGGCELRVIVAIDYTASNGDPRKEDSLHHFKKDGGMNTYEETISKICTILSEYDSDQKFPVYGFGAKKGGTLNNCFPVTAGVETEVEGVEGILAAYKGAFKTGIAMSKPTDITQVIATAGKEAKESLASAIKEGSQNFTILTIFTNGNVHSVEETVAALGNVAEAPLSVVVMGVGPSDFGDMSFLNECQEKDGTRVHFVDTKLLLQQDGDDNENDKALTEKTLSVIPKQLVSYFSSKNIQPNPPVEPDEIVIEPFSEPFGAQPGIVVSENGDISVEAGATGGDADANENNDTSTTLPGGVKISEPLQAGIGKGKTMFLAQARKQFGKISKQMERNINRTIDQKVNKMFGIKNATGGKKKNQRKKR